MRDLGIDEVITLKQFLKEYGISMWTELNWLRTGLSDMLMNTVMNSHVP